MPAENLTRAIVKRRGTLHGAGPVAQAAVPAKLGVQDRVAEALRVFLHGEGAERTRLDAGGAAGALRLYARVEVPVDHLRPFYVRQEVKRLGEKIERGGPEGQKRPRGRIPVNA